MGSGGQPLHFTIVKTHCPPRPLFSIHSTTTSRSHQTNAYQVVETPRACPSSSSRCRFSNDHQTSCVRDGTSHIHIPYFTSQRHLSVGAVCADEHFGIIIPSTCCEVREHYKCVVDCVHTKSGPGNVSTLFNHATSHLRLPLGHKCVLRPSHIHLSLRGYHTYCAPRQCWSGSSFQYHLPLSRPVWSISHDLQTFAVPEADKPRSMVIREDVCSW